MRATIIVAIVAACLPAAGQEWFFPFYDQPVDPDGYAFTSMNVPGLHNTADDLWAPHGLPIMAVVWYGGYLWSEGPKPIEGFNIRFYFDDEKNGVGVPGTLVYDRVYAGNAHEEDTGLVGGDGFKVWYYWLYVEPIHWREGETYWLSISCIPGWDPWQNDKFWGWRTAADVTGRPGVQAPYTGDHEGMWVDGVETGCDFAFAVGTVPEPPSIWLAGGLVLSLTARAFWSRRGVSRM